MNKPGLLIRETVRMAFASLGAHKLRTALTVTGITIGVFSVIGVMTAVSALRGSIESGLSFLGANTFQFAKWPAISINGNDWAKYSRRHNITLAEAERYQQLMAGEAEVVCFSTYLNGTAQAKYLGRKTTPGMNFGGTNEYFLAANQFTIEIGRNFTAGDVALGAPVAIIGQDVVAKLFPSESPLGKQIKVNNLAYTVIGTFAAKGMSFGQSQDAIVMVPIRRFLRDNGAQQYTLEIATEAPAPELYNETMDKGISAMRIARGLKPGVDNDFEVYSNDSLLAAFAKVADAIRAGAFIISAIALVAAGVGIMNIMLVSVTERTKEIGVRKSIGARKVNILSQFLFEAVVISLAGGLAGILLGVVAGDALALILHAGIVFPWGWAAAGLLVCSAIGIGFGFYPALMAAGLDPIEALRYE
jgi:putative ABC transport system permease protein